MLANMSHCAERERAKAVVTRFELLFELTTSKPFRFGKLAKPTSHHGMAFVYAKAKNLPKKYAGAFGYGDVWTWTALDADSKLVPSWAVGRRDGFTAQALVMVAHEGSRSSRTPAAATRPG